MRLRRPIAFILSAAVAAGALTGCDSFSGHAAAAANSAQVQQLIEFIADLGLERDLRQALQKGGDLRQALLTLLGLENAVNFNVDDLTGARPGQHAVQVWEVTAQSAEDAAALAASQIRAVLEQLKSSGVTEGRIGMVEVDGKYYVVVDVEVTEENTFEPAKPVSDDDDDNEDTPSASAPTAMVDGKTIDLSSLGTEITADEILELAGKDSNNTDAITALDLSGCTGLQSIGASAFLGCKSLTNIDLSGCTGLQSIGASAFLGCKSLTNIDLSGCTSLESIGSLAFADCQSLTSINLSGCTNLKSIGKDAFQYCSQLTKVTLPESLESIGDRAFANSGLTEINLSGCASLKSIRNEAFANSGLTEINLSDCRSLESIGIMAFAESGLTSITLPSNLQTIGISAFWGCSGLENITFYNVPAIGDHAFYSVISDGKTLTIYCPNNIRDALREKLTQSGSFTADDFTGDKIEFADIATLTYPLGF